MRIGLITDNPGHPLLSAAAGLMRAAGHGVELLDPGAADGACGAPADVYLLKAHTPRGLDLARRLERRGAPVVNSAAATTLCQDRTLMAELAVRAGLPFAGTRTFDALAGWAAAVTVDSPWSSRAGTAAARTSWPGSTQTRSCGSWRTAGPTSRWWCRTSPRTTAGTTNCGRSATRSSPRCAVRTLPGGRGPTLPLPRLPAGWADLTRQVGEVFSLDVYGVDIIATADGAPLIVDINAFPGIREQPGAPEALAELTLRRAKG